MNTQQEIYVKLFTFEIFRPRSAVLFLIGWLCVFGAVFIATILATPKCYEYSSLERVDCGTPAKNLTRTTPASSLLWSSAQSNFSFAHRALPISSIMIQFFVLNVSNNTIAFQPLTATQFRFINETNQPLASLSVVNSISKSLRKTSLLTFDASNSQTLLLPFGYQIPPGTRSMQLVFGSLPSLDVNDSFCGLVMVSNTDYQIFDIVARYALISVVVFGCVVVGRDTQTGKYWTNTPTISRIAVVFSLLSIVAIDPLSFGAAVAPSNPFWQVWQWHLAPAFRMILLYALTAVVATLIANMEYLGDLQKLTRKVALIVFVFFFPYFGGIVTAWALNSISTPFAVVSAFWGSIPCFSSVNLLAFWYLFIFWMYRQRVLWKKRDGYLDARVALFGFELKSVVLLVRLWASILLVFWVLYFGVVFPTTIGISSATTASRLLISGLGDAILVAAVACSLLYFARVELLPGSKWPTPLHPLVVKNPLAVQVSPTSVTLPLLPQCTSADQKQNHFFVPQPWTAEQFRCLVEYHLCADAFYSAHDKRQFDRAVINVPNRRSFFCWETATDCLNLSNEVYLDLQEDRETECLVIQHEATCGEQCLGCCCFCSPSAVVAADGANAKNDTIDGLPDTSSRRFRDHCETAPPENSKQPLSTSPKSSPKSPTKTASSPRAGCVPSLNVKQFGFELVKLIEALGVRVIVAIRRSLDPMSGALLEVIVAFRGTINARNALTDVSIGRSSWSEMPNSQAKVHSGFLDVWEALKPLLIPTLSAILLPRNDASEDRSSSFTFASYDSAEVHITGHSLGGAVAALCFFSVKGGDASCYFAQRAAAVGADMRKINMDCYTFGMPKVGNDTFRRQYGSVSQDLYRIVNENDAVAVVGHCGREHIGREISIDRDGNTVVEPGFLEQFYFPLRGEGSSFRNHLMDRYANSFDNVFASRNLDLSYVTFMMKARIAQQEKVLPS